MPLRNPSTPSDSHAEAHTVASHSDTTATGAETETLSDGSNADALHTHAHDTITSGTIADHDTGATGAELDTLTDGSNADALHAHAASGALVFAGNQTTEGTTTSTSAVDLLSSTLGTSIAAGAPFTIVAPMRKTSGAAAGAGCGVKINSTTVAEAAVSGSVPRFASTDEAEDGVFEYLIGPRVTNYQGGMSGHHASTGASNGNLGTMFKAAGSAGVPIATVTAVVVRGISSASVTLGADELYIHSKATS